MRNSAATRWLTVNEAASELHAAPRTVQFWITSGRLNAQKLPGKTGAYLIDPTEIERVKAERASA